MVFAPIPEIVMAGTSVTRGPHWDVFIALMLKDKRYGSTSELIRASLRLMEEQEGQRARLRVALIEGKRCGDAGHDRNQIPGASPVGRGGCVKSG